MNDDVFPSIEFCYHSQGQTSLCDAETIAIIIAEELAPVEEKLQHLFNAYASKGSNLYELLAAVQSAIDYAENLNDALITLRTEWPPVLYTDNEPTEIEW